MMRDTRSVVFALAVAALLSARSPVYGHGDVMRIGSSQPGNGQLLIEPDFDFDLRVLLDASSTLGDRTLYDSIFPSFTWVLEPRPADGIYPLDERVTVQIALASVTPSASMRIGGRTLDAPAESSILGSFDPDPESHVHPEWRLILPNEVTGEYEICFALMTSAAGYTVSPNYCLVLTNVEQESTPTATPTPTAAAETPTATATGEATATSTATFASSATPTATPTDGPSATPTPTLPGAGCVGDCSGDGAVAVDELVRIVALAAGSEVEECVAADGNGDRTISISEVVWAIRSALEGCEEPAL
jgi:hypothetical protein